MAENQPEPKKQDVEEQNPENNQEQQPVQPQQNSPENNQAEQPVENQPEEEKVNGNQPIEQKQQEEQKQEAKKEDDIEEQFDISQYRSKKWRDLKSRDGRQHISEALIKNLQALNFRQASKIQAKAIPILIARNDMSMIAQAVNGEGKTLAYSIPLIEKINDSKSAIENRKFYPQAIVLCHTRELCKQVAEEINKINQGYKKIETVVFVGGGKQGDKKKKVNDRNHVIVGTPGKIYSIIKGQWFRPKIDLSRVRFFVADEADELMASGNESNKKNYANVMSIIERIPKKAQINFFSATFPPEIRSGIEAKINERQETKAVHIKVAVNMLKLKKIKQFYIKGRVEKGKIIDKVLRKMAGKTVITFVNTKHFAKQINDYLFNQGHQIANITGGHSKEEREQLMKMYHEEKLKLLITTDLLARGYDNREIHLVINLDIPKLWPGEEPNYQTYMHRIGRTGRFGDNGVALNIIDEPADLERLFKIRDKYEFEMEEIKDMDKLLELVNRAEEQTKLFKQALQDDDDL